MSWRHAVLLLFVVAVTLAVFMLPAISQNEAYHNFADQRELIGIPNCLNVVLNGLFLVFGIMGIRYVGSKSPTDRTSFIDPVHRLAYLLFFIAVAATSLGSSYYHLHPDDARLVWDRLPMAVGFLSLVAAIVCERTTPKNGARYLLLLPLWGAWSVYYWHATQDLRPYVIAQFGSLLALILLMVLFPARYTRNEDLMISLAWYGLAKILEAADRPIFSMGRIVSGHTLKHIAAAISAYWILRMLELRRPLAAN
jgi:hypothetical protein